MIIIQWVLVQLEDSQWSKDTSKWAWANDLGLQQAGAVQHATWENHNKFGVKMLRTKRSTNFCKHYLEKQPSTLHTQIQDWKGKLEIAKV
jgi:hypothetical protein